MKVCAKVQGERSHGTYKEVDGFRNTSLRIQEAGIRPRRDIGRLAFRSEDFILRPKNDHWRVLNRMLMLHKRWMVNICSDVSNNLSKKF